jgi:hypothetical protein
MSAEETEFNQAMHTLAEFVRILVKEYPLVFKKGTGDIKIHPSMQPVFPYEVSLKIQKKEQRSAKRKKKTKE